MVFIYYRSEGTSGERELAKPRTCSKTEILSKTSLGEVSVVTAMIKALALQGSLFPESTRGLEPQLAQSSAPLPPSAEDIETVPPPPSWAGGGRGAGDRSCVSTFGLEAPADKGWSLPTHWGFPGGWLESFPQCLPQYPAWRSAPVYSWDSGQNSCLLRKMSSRNWAKDKG